MTRTIAYLAIGASLIFLVLPAIIVTAILPGGGTSCTPAITAGNAQPQQFDADQLAIAQTIVATGTAKGIPHWGLVIALATAMQESGLRNLPHLGNRNNHDSLGVFQQRPSQGWGTPEQLAKPEYQAERFYAKLVTIENWQQLPLTQAAQSVQVSAYPNAYEKHTQPAIQLAAQLSHATAAGDGTSACWSGCPPAAATRTNAPATGTPAQPQECSTLTRAQTWLTAYNGGPVPYSANTDPATYFNGYRRDCSGFASMTLGLPGPGLNTAGLAARSHMISKEELRPGDLLINPAPGGAGHVVIFDHWTDHTMTAYIGFEQTGSDNTVHRRIPYPYFGSYHLDPYRFSQVRQTQTTADRS